MRIPATTTSGALSRHRGAAMHTVMAIVVVMAALPAFGATPKGRPESRDRGRQVVTSDPHKHLDHILRRPLFQRWRLRQQRALTRRESDILEGLREMLEAAMKPIGDFLDWLMRRVAAPGEGGPWGLLGGGLATILKTLGWIAIAGLVVFFAVLFYKLLRSRSGPTHAARVLSRERIKEALDAGEALALDGAGWLREAERLAGEKNFRAMYRALYLSLLSGLHSAGKIDFRKNRTNWTYVERFRGEDKERDVFASLTDLFDRVWYGFLIPESTALADIKGQVVFLLGGGGASD